MKRADATRMLEWAAIALLVAIGAPVRADEGSTFAAMQIAYAREVNARTAYLAFANRAEAERQPEAACLFRAVARAESVHAAGHATVIEQLGGVPAARPADVALKETAENLRAAILLEMKERCAVYPMFEEYARTECLYDAYAACNYARGAEATHERLFRAALWRLEQAAAGEARDLLASLEPMVLPDSRPPCPTFYVCLGDGSVYTQPVKRCTECGASGERIVECACER